MPQITFTNSINDEVFYIDRKNEVKKGIIEYCEVRADGNNYIINSDRIAEADIKTTFDDVKTKLTADVQAEFNIKVAKIEKMKEDDFIKEVDEKKEVEKTLTK